MINVGAVTLSKPMRTRWQHIGAICLLSVWGCTTATAATPFGIDRDRTLDQLVHTTWTAKDGLPGEVVIIAQTPDGYLWLGTQHGLYRFDGVHFERYQPKTGPFPREHVYSLLPLPDGGLWIGYYLGGASYLKDDRLTNYDERQGLPVNTLRNFLRHQDGSIWALTGDKYLMRLKASQWEIIGEDWGFPGNPESALVDGIGTLWVLSGETVYSLAKGEQKFKQILKGVPAYGGFAETLESLSKKL